MTKSSPAPADHWAVSARSSGGIVTAGVTLPGIELSLLGIPPGFTEPEIQTWLRDLAGVAIETSRSDNRSRPIPPLLHHALTGLLFSQTELWSHTGHPLPFAAVFVHGPQGVAFGWVGRARAVLLVNGEPHEPQWVIVRDESGQEAMSASLPADAHVLLTLEYWPTGETGSPAPASIDAEFGPGSADDEALAEAEEEDAPSPGERVSSIEIELDEPDVEPWGHPIAGPAPAAHGAQSPSARATLPTEQPGLAQDPTGIRFSGGEDSQTLPSTRNPSAGTFAMPGVPKPPEPRELNERRVSSEHDEQDLEPEPAPGEHPIGRWLQKLMGFARKRDDVEPEAQAPPAKRPSRSEPAARPAASAAPPLRPPALHPQRAVEEPRRAPAPPPVPEIDIEEPHVLPPPRAVAPATPPSQPAPAQPASAQSPPAQPASAPPASVPGLAAAGMSEIFGAMRPAATGPATTPPAGAKPATTPPAGAQPAKPQPAGTQPARAQQVHPAPARPAVGASESGSHARPQKVEGLTGMSSAGHVSGPSQPKFRIPDEPAPGTPPYPMLDVTRPPGTRGPIQIDHEPVGADTGFAIPKLPSRGAPAPPSAVRPPANPPQPVPPSPTSARGVGTPATPPPTLNKPTRRQGDVPEPPTEFLERFAASMRVAPGLEPTPQESWPPDARSGSPKPPAPGSEPPAAAPPAAPPAGALRGGPPPLPSSRRAAAQARPVIPPAPETPVETPITAPVLRAPSETAPVPVEASGMREMLRELPLAPAEPVPGTEETDDVPDGVLVARPSKPRPQGAPSRVRGRGEWPDLDELENGPTPFWRRPWVVIAFITVMVGIGWVVGHSQSPDNDVHATPMSRLLRTVGLGGARFTADIDTDPPGAWIAIDGKDLGRRTPSTVELLPGAHTLTLSMPDLGEVKVDLKGRRGQKVKVNEALHGSLDVVGSDPSLPVQMSLDGAPQGYLPVHVTKLPPGLHELQFSGPRMQPWAQNVNVGIRKKTKVVSRPMLSPATGVVQVLAQMNDENGSAPLSGATVYVDGDLRGTTPATIELPRGPHSLRVQFEGVTAPIQVIDLPGGNKRFATFQFGLDSDLPPLRLDGATKQLLSKTPAVVSATLDGLEAEDLREAWLHVLMPNGLWSRFPMTIEPGDRGAVLNVSFPVSEYNGEQKATWYLSAVTKQGDDFFTEMQRSGR